MVGRAQVRGFTLIELLIAVTIMSLVIGLASYAFSLFSSHWQRPRAEFTRAAGQLQRVDLLVRALTDALPWAVKSDQARIGFYFLGREEGLTLVSGSPVFDTGHPAVIRIFRESQVDGRWRLVYEEASLGEVVLRDASQELPFDRRMIVLEGLSQIRFDYFGWSSVDQRALASDTGARPDWSIEFDGLVRVQQPLKIAMTLGNFRSEIQMPERTDVLLGRLSASE